MLVVLSLIISCVCAVPTVTVSRVSSTQLGFTYTQTTNQLFTIFGFADTQNGTTITTGLACNAGASGSCIQIFCTAGFSTCRRVDIGAEIFSAIVVSASNISFIRDVFKTPAMNSLPNVYMAYYESASAASPLNIADVTGVSTSPVAVGVAGSPVYTVATPAWGLTFGRPSETGISATMVPSAGQTVFLGWKASTIAPNPPPEGIICTLAASGLCVEFSCAIAAGGGSTCSAPTAGNSNFTANAVSSTSAIVIVKSVGAIAIGENMFLSHSSIATPIAITAASAQSQSWYEHGVPTPTFIATTAPTFSVVFSRPFETTLGVSIVPRPGKTIFFGWRTGESVSWPADSVICAAGSVDTCLDVACTSAHTCNTRATTIYTTNAATSASISLARLLASGSAPLTATGKMWLAYSLADTASGTTTLDALTAQGRTWSYYAADVPAVGTNHSIIILPSLISALCILYAL